MRYSIPIVRLVDPGAPRSVAGLRKPLRRRRQGIAKRIRMLPNSYALRLCVPSAKRSITCIKRIMFGLMSPWNLVRPTLQLSGLSLSTASIEMRYMVWVLTYAIVNSLHGCPFYVLERLQRSSGSKTRLLAYAQNVTILGIEFRHHHLWFKISTSQTQVGL